jgi:hypothetical protein
MLIWNGFPAFATVYNSDGSSTNIQYIHDNLAVDGDTIAIPAGTFSWTTTLTITKAITLQGAGVGHHYQGWRWLKCSTYRVDIAKFKFSFPPYRH